MTLLDLFSGIGGFSLAASWVWGDDLDIVAFCEMDPYCQQVLRRHWPGVPIIGRIQDVTVDRVANLWHNTHDSNMEEVMGKRNPKYDHSPSLYEAGLSVQDIADFYGVTRQAMWKILKRRGAEMRSNLRNGEDNHFHRGGETADDHAQNVCEVAVRKGILSPEPCEVCGDHGKFKDGRRKVQAHHDDYNKPLEVRWLCQKCHHEWHKHNQAKRKEVMPCEAPQIDLLTGGFP